MAVFAKIAVLGSGLFGLSAAMRTDSKRTSKKLRTSDDKTVVIKKPGDPTINMKPGFDGAPYIGPIPFGEFVLDSEGNKIMAQLPDSDFKL